MNERTHYLYKNISLTLYSRKGWCWLCVRGELERRTDSYTLTQVLLAIAALLSRLGWDGSNRGSRRAASPQSASWYSRWHLVPNLLQLQLTQAVCVLVIFLFDVHLLPLFFRLFTQVHLLIDGSVEGQYVTVVAVRVPSRQIELFNHFLYLKTFNCVQTNISRSHKNYNPKTIP